MTILSTPTTLTQADILAGYTSDVERHTADLMVLPGGLDVI